MAATIAAATSIAKAVVEAAKADLEPLIWRLSFRRVDGHPQDHELCFSCRYIFILSRRPPLIEIHDLQMIRKLLY